MNKLVLPEGEIQLDGLYGWSRAESQLTSGRASFAWKREME